MPIHHTLKIQNITSDDRDAILEVYRQCEDFLALGPEPKASMAMVLKDIEEARNEGAGFRGIHNARGKMVGVVSYIASGFEGRPEDAFIFLLMITPPYRRQGYGAEVVCRIEKKIHRNPRVKSILSAVQVNNTDAIRFWQEDGYQIIGVPELRPDKTTVYRLLKDL